MGKLNSSAEPDAPKNYATWYTKFLTLASIFYGKTLLGSYPLWDPIFHSVAEHPEHLGRCRTFLIQGVHRA
jgi:hypothetical protein